MSGNPRPEDNAVPNTTHARTEKACRRLPCAPDTRPIPGLQRGASPLIGQSELSQQPVQVVGKALAFPL